MRIPRRRQPDDPLAAHLVGLARQKREVGPNGWTCHVCGDYRPDDAIAVVSSKRMVGGVEVTQNVRYCIDRESCVRGALDVRFVPEDL